MVKWVCKTFYLVQSVLNCYFQDKDKVSWVPETVAAVLISQVILSPPTTDTEELSGFWSTGAMADKHETLVSVWENQTNQKARQEGRYRFSIPSLTMVDFCIRG